MANRIGTDGDDTISTGSDDDIVWANGGNDSVTTGDGNDEAWGGAGNDLIRGGGGGDTLGGDQGDDTIDGGAGNDKLWGGSDDDRITGGAGNDTIGGGSGHDTLSGDDGDDEVWGDSGDDSINGGTGNDTLDGGGGDDRMGGGAGDDDLHGGAGSDTIAGGAGNDAMAGGTDADVFIVRDGNGHDTISDFDVTEDRLAFDMAEITRFPDAQARMTQDGADTVFTFDNGDTLRLLNVSRDDLRPSNTQSVDGPICLCAGTPIATPDGFVKVEMLRPGDSVLTLDGAPMPVRLIVCEKHRFRSRDDRAKPILIGAGSLGPDLPRGPLRVSPQHRVLMQAPLTGAEHLVAAVKLLGWPGVRRMRGLGQADYYNILLDRHAILNAGGVAVESLLVTAHSLARLPPDIRTLQASRPAMQPARPICRSAEGLRGVAFDARSQPLSRRPSSPGARHGGAGRVRWPA